MNKFVKELLNIDKLENQKNTQTSYINIINKIKNKGIPAYNTNIKNKLKKKLFIKNSLPSTNKKNNYYKSNKILIKISKKNIQIPFYNYSYNLKSIATKKKNDYDKSLKIFKLAKKKCVINFKNNNNYENYNSKNNIFMKYLKKKLILKKLLIK